MRPYRAPHYQKAAKEEIIKQLIKKGEIQETFSPFSSPAIMVRKKDGGWRLCVDYRELNAITVKNKFHNGTELFYSDRMWDFTSL